MTSNINPIIDPSGQMRRCGTIPKLDVAAKNPVYADSQIMYTDDQIKTLLASPNRIPSRVTFDKTWILDQMNFGSCQGHGEAGALQRVRFRRGLQKILLSGAYAYSKVNGGSDNGSALVDGLAACQKYGIAPLSLVNATMIYPKLQPSTADAEAAKHKALVAYATPTLAEVRSALAAFHPVVVAISAGNNFMKLDGNGVGGIDSGSGDHAVCLDDLKFSNGIWLYDMANSWGISVGVDGRWYLRDGNFTQTISHHMFYALVSSEESDDE